MNLGNWLEAAGSLLSWEDLLGDGEEGETGHRPDCTVSFCPCFSSLPHPQPAPHTLQRKLLEPVVASVRGQALLSSILLGLWLLVVKSLVATARDAGKSVKVWRRLSPGRWRWTLGKRWVSWMEELDRGRGWGKSTQLFWWKRPPGKVSFVALQSFEPEPRIPDVLRIGMTMQQLVP